MTTFNIKTTALAGLALVSVFSFMTTNASASVVALPTVDGLGYFQDTNTGYTWEKLTNFFNQNTSTQIANLQPGFAEATLAQVDQLTSGSMPLPGSDNATFESYKSIVGGSGYRDLLWGNDDNGGANNWFYAYSTESSWSNYNPGNTAAFGDLGLWAVNTNGVTATPEPSTTASFGIAGFGIAAMLAAAAKRRRAAKSS